MPDASLLNEWLKAEIRRVLKTLSPRKETIIKRYFGIDLEPLFSLEAIAARFRLTGKRAVRSRHGACSGCAINPAPKIFGCFCNPPWLTFTVIFAEYGG